MFFQLSAFIITSLAMLAAASPVELATPIEVVARGQQNCGNGNGVYCCNSSQSVS